MRREEDIRSIVEAVFDRERRRIAKLLPRADVRHIGSTSIPGSLTKGDLDLLVRVARVDFAAAVGALSEIYDQHQVEMWEDDFASFVLPFDGEIEVGVQLVIASGASDLLFLGFRDLLRSRPDLRDAYDEIKASHRDEDVDRYRAAKAVFIGEVMGTTGAAD